MKYDSGMTHFHKDIIAALQHMLGNNSEITEKFSSNDGSPAPLRDYLKEKYGKSYTSHIGNGMRYSCKTSTGFELTFDTILNNPGEKNLTLSWSQVAKFIRDNWDEVFKKDKPKTDPIEVSAEKQPTYLDKLREKYPKISIEDEWLFEDYCPLSVFLGGKIPHENNDLCIKQNKYGKADEHCQECWNSPCAAYVTFDDNNILELFEEDYFEQYPAEDTAEADTVPEISEEKSNVEKSLDRETTQKWDLYCEGCKYDINSCCDYPETPDDYCVCGDKRIPKSEADKPTEAQTATTAETVLQSAFDYSELDSDTAKNLRECETVIRQETAGYFTLLGAKFKEAQALLANHASGTFEKWYTAMGFKRQTVYNLIQRYDFLGSPTIGGREDTFEALPLTLSYEVSKPDAPAELVEKVLEGDITTNAEYLKLKAELDRTREECRQLDANSAAKDKEYEQQLEEANKRAETAEMQSRTYEQNYHRMAKNFDETCDKNIKLEQQIKELESRPVDVAVQDNSELMEELEQLREENKRLKDDSVKSFLIRLTMDEFEGLINALDSKPQLQDIIKRAEIIKL